MIRVDPKCHHIYCYKREAEDRFGTHRGESHVKTEAEMGVM